LRATEAETEHNIVSLAQFMLFYNAHNKQNIILQIILKR
jgi:hypothetical protein